MTTEQLSALLTADPAGTLEGDRQRYDAQIRRAADIVQENAECRPVVLLAGPSGSGKTTSALLLERELDSRGLETHTLQMDDWFSPLTPEEIRLMEENKMDLERPDRVDIPLFQAQLDEILNCREVALPRYNFVTSKREYTGRTLQRKPGEVVIIEGIHALNPEVSGHMENTTRIYVSVRTRVTTGCGQTLHPSKIRLARRLLRDSTGRGRPMSYTIGMRGRVDRGEQNYIMPYKHLAHCSIDTFHRMELGVYRESLYPQLETFLPENPDLTGLVEVLREIPPVDQKLIPGDSLLREFIGGSQLDY